MNISMVGLNHNTAPLEVREKLAFGKKQVKEAQASLLNYVSEGVILSTCNRTEVYVLSDHSDLERQKLEDFLSDRFFPIPHEGVEKFCHQGAPIHGVGKYFALFSAILTCHGSLLSPG